MNLPELSCKGQSIRIVQATLSCDEDSPFWIAQVEVASLTDFAAIGVTDPITLTLGSEVFALVVDGKTLSRASAVEPHCVISCVSPLALLDAPFTGTPLEQPR